MRIFIIGVHDYRNDEGMKNFYHELSIHLAKNNEIYTYNIKNRNPFLLWKKIRNFKPQIIHFILRPSLLTLFLAKISKLAYRDAKLVITSLQPPLNLGMIKLFSRIFRPDLVLVQSKETEEIFKEINYRTSFLPSGFDNSKFYTVSQDYKDSLRQKYGLDKDLFVVLHVGHINKGRNLDVLADMAKELKVIIVGSTNDFNYNNDVHEYLKDKGCLVWRKYFNNIEEIYQLSDCYVFPTINPSYAIEMPLSVIEALACNIPVITFNFGGIKRLSSPGITYVENNKDMINEIRKRSEEDLMNDFSKDILAYSWEIISNNLQDIYKDLVRE